MAQGVLVLLKYLPDQNFWLGSIWVSAIWSFLKTAWNFRFLGRIARTAHRQCTNFHPNLAGVCYF